MDRGVGVAVGSGVGVAVGVGASVGDGSGVAPGCAGAGEDAASGVDVASVSHAIARAIASATRPTRIGLCMSSVLFVVGCVGGGRGRKHHITARVCVKATERRRGVLTGPIRSHVDVVRNGLGPYPNKDAANAVCGTIRSRLQGHEGSR